MLRLEDVRKQYKDFKLCVSMEVKPGYITGLIGRNGAGKTTAFKAALGLIYADSGTITVLGKPIASLCQEDREDIGVVLADSGFSGYLSIQDLVPVLKHLYKRFDKELFLKKCEEASLPVDKKIKDFSTGMKRKLQIIAAVSHDARLLVLDDPTSGMDIVAREEFLDLIREYMEKEGRAVLISSHISGDLEKICDDIYMIDKGEVTLHEETDVLLDAYGVLKATDAQYQELDKSYILCSRKERYGYSCLTKERQFYMENYPEVVIEKGTVDEIIKMMSGGEA